MSLPASPPLISVSLYLVVAVIWAGPIGLHVLRRRLANASGARLAAKVALIGLTTLTAPLAALMALIVLVGIGETTGQFWSLLMNAW